MMMAYVNNIADMCINNVWQLKYPSATIHPHRGRSMRLYGHAVNLYRSAMGLPHKWGKGGWLDPATQPWNRKILSIESVSGWRENAVPKREKDSAAWEN